MYIDHSVDCIITPTSVQSVKAFKAECKRVLLQFQKDGSVNDWTENNFLLYSIRGLRKSSRTVNN